MEKPLFIPLKREFFEQFESGVKRFEFRPYGPRWNEKTGRMRRPAVQSDGSGNQRRLRGFISGFDKHPIYACSPSFQACYPGFEGMGCRIEVSDLKPLAA